MLIVGERRPSRFVSLSLHDALPIWLWKQLVVAPDADAPANTSRTEIIVVLSLAVAAGLAVKVPALFGLPLNPHEEVPDRKSTRLNSSHSSISYAVFCLTKKICCTIS